MARRPSRPAPLPISIAHLLPPCPNAPESPLPSPSAAVLGPLPPTSALHLALNYIALSDLPEYGQDDTESIRKDFKRALIVTGDQGRYHDAIEEDDEDWMRERGGEYGVLHRLRRVDMRFCPSPQHFQLLFNLLTADRAFQSKDPPKLPRVPGLVILWDMARTLMEEEEADMENIAPGMDEEGESLQAFWVWSDTNRVTIDTYLSLVTAARAAVDHLSSLHPIDPPVQLVILEPHLDQTSSLPILGQTREGPKEGMSTPNRERRIAIRDGLEWLFGRDAMGYIEDHPVVAESDIPAASHTLTFSRYPHEHFPILRHRCPRSQWSAAAALERPTENLEPKEGEVGGWRWSWLPQKA
ncbi:hypothetical protein BCR39DRAFT_563753 [Naematelia encephala]|uniref:Uncharacterized protein n=1 Tax=Naematelia encephala TaxID=71784 RepID=A0A1Y2BGQ5_9TREE|nr:hypothetical protein BCR39DRAFT_563753 [Naematelia encephala]